MDNKNPQKTNHHHHPNKIATTVNQLDLNMKSTSQGKYFIKKKYKLSDNQMRVMEIFSLNDRALSPVEIKELAQVNGINCVCRFITRAKGEGWIRELKKIPGATVNNLFAFYRMPDTLEDGQVVKDRRCKYYKITEMGMKIFSINEKHLSNTDAKLTQFLTVSKNETKDNL